MGKSCTSNAPGLQKGRILKIAIDARWIFEQLSGIGIYTRELIRNLAGLDHQNDYLLIFDKPVLLRRTCRELHISSHSNFAACLVPYGVFSVRNQVLMPGLLKRNAINVFHSTNYMIPLPAFTGSHRPGKAKCVTTIHDLIPLVIPHHAPKSKKTLIFPIYKQLMFQVGARSDAVITVSNRSRRDVIKRLRIASGQTDKVTAIPNGVSSSFHPPQQDRSRSESDSEERVRKLLYVGRTDPYKNVSMLVKMLARLKQLCSFPVELHLISSPDPRYPEPLLLSEKLHISDAVKWRGYLADEDMVKVYQNADVLVHPSQYEGFGLQIIEAMASGLPVVCSNGGSLPEIAGNAAIILDPHDEDGFVSAVLDLFASPEKREDLRSKGIEQASRFSWQRTARETLEVYRSVSKPQQMTSNQ